MAQRSFGLHKELAIRLRDELDLDWLDLELDLHPPLDLKKLASRENILGSFLQLTDFQDVNYHQDANDYS